MMTDKINSVVDTVSAAILNGMTNGVKNGIWEATRTKILFEKPSPNIPI